ncbi:sodium-dependent noradrenaline transporter [Pyrenophora tritici-repentis Pt-1C-BFP]|uniref:Sodium-dependent noradrenaline transporter n=2 Tax=Pyrenophora tritici-repentis TaxID=45151 RepID=B2WCY7_PYRTR|nr:sodium-dependent noradrenaline transporter [Pyrenophora tritici-repentis Pt-1C-BFP]EDU50765.1 sodium-dependent noradrenaline transporter [Pyrenophora tritici-repentis Pt-1C-BFP]
MAMPFLRMVGNYIAPPAAKSEDGRDQWPSRAAFLLAAMGGCAGQGNLLRYPSVLYNNYVNNMNRRLKGVGMGPVIVSFLVVQYFTVNLAWIMQYFRYSFTSPLPWENRIDEFYYNDVLQRGNITEGSLSADGNSVASFTVYPSKALLGETVAWSIFVWFLIWISIFRGVGMTGRVVYFTMGLPIVTTIIFVGRALSLPNAREGVDLVWRTWRSDQLASGVVWQTAVGQVFFSTGIGFGYFTSYASYNTKHANAVMDACLICGSNVLFENFAAFAVFGVVGYLRRWPQDGVRLGAFVVGFLTLPEAVLQMPGANFWAVLLFFTLVVLGFSSAFVMLDVVVTLICDSGLVKASRPVVVTALTVLSFLMCLPYCTEFGYYLLDGIDRWVNNVALIFVVWSEVSSATTVYRWRDIVDQTGLPAFIVYNIGFFGGQVFGISLAHGIGRPGAGAGAGIGFYALFAIIAVLLARTPDARAPSFWNCNAFIRRLWFLAFYSGNQLRRDLNVIVGQGKNWKIPAFMPFLLRYLSGPVLAIILSFAFPEFHTLRYDPMMIAGFILSILTIIVILLGLIMPRYYDAFIPVHRRFEGTEPTVAMQTKDELGGRPIADVVTAEQGDSGILRDSSSVQEVNDDKKVKKAGV